SSSFGRLLGVRRRYDGQVGEGEGEAAGLGHREQDRLARREATRAHCFFERDEDARRSRVAAGLEVGEPAIGVERRDAATQRVECEVTERVGAVVAQHMVEMVHVYQARVDELLELS